MPTEERRDAHRAATWAHVASMVVGGLGLIWLGRNHWFILDEWEFITNRGFDHPVLGIFAPHTQHWTTGPIVLYRLLLELFGLHTYIPFLAVNVAVYVLSIHLSWRVAVRAGADRWVATGLAALLLCSAASGNQAFSAFQIAFAGSVAAGLGLLLLVDHRAPLGRARGASIALLAVVSLTFSSVSVPLIAAAAALLALRRGIGVTVVVFSPAAAAFVIWYLAVGRDTIGRGAGSARLSVSALRHAPRFVRDGLAATFGGPLRMGTGSGLLLAVVVAGSLVAVLRNWRGRGAIAAAAAIAGLLFFFVTALGRGDDTPSTARYLYVGGAVFLPVVAVACNRLVRRGVVVRVALGVAVALLLLVNTRDLRATSRDEAAVRQHLRERVVAAAATTRVDPGIPDALVPDIADAPDLTIGKLRDLMRFGWVPDPDHIDPRELQRARTYPHAGLVIAPPAATTGSASVATEPSGQHGADAPGCGTVRAAEPRTRVVVEATRGAVLTITASSGGAVQLLRADQRGQPRGIPLPIVLAAGAPAFVEVPATEDLVVIPSGNTSASVCALRAG